MRVTADFAPIWEIGEPRADSYTGTGGASPRKGRKRSRSIQTSDAEEDDSIPSPDPRARKQYRSRIDIKDQYYVAGHDPDQPLPSASFPHSPIPSKRGAPSADESEDAFASLNPPLHAVPPSRQVEQPSLQRQHVAVMTSVLHMSLLRGDYHRAGQAFGLLLRAAPSKTNINLRCGGAWGIGAEILLRHSDKSKVPPSDIHLSSYEQRLSPPLSSQDEEVSSHRANLSSENIARAKKYYESLILQYPFDKLNPNSTDARTFYPALFSLMIHEASEDSKAASTSLLPPASVLSSEEDSDADSSGQASERQAAIADIKRAELAKARAIAGQIDDIIVTPPYDRFVPLLRMRGMVGLWEADLLAVVSRAESSDGNSSDDIATDMASSTRMKAMELLQRVRNMGGQLPEGMERHIK
ncbi:Hypothetical protein D9617_8g050950 [Elsinoe fawcettii]|nr:Hypothetical protein D9617_8g050950 [Elsinoe fawcettii]